MADDYYGTVVRVRVKPGCAEDVRRLFHNHGAAPSSVAITVIRSDEDPDVLWVAGVHRSREAYRANAETPEQKARFAELSRYLVEGEAPQWHDGEVLWFDAH